ncbi:MAG: 23S rRNA (uracil(1939)-C(5))-methyltransferase RlmD [Eubacteriaceae bacterium]
MKSVELKEKYEIDIIDLTSTGEGVGKVDNFTIFVEGTVTGDKVLVMVQVIKKKYAIGKLLKIIKPSCYRVEPPCMYFDKCGGCQIQNIDYKYQLDIKSKQIKDNLKRIGGFDLKELNIKSIIGMDSAYNYRNKAQYKVSKNGIGFYEKKTHKVIPIKECLIQSEISQKIISYVNEFVTENNVSIYDEQTHTGILRGIVERVSYYNDEIMLILVLNVKSFNLKEKFIKYINKNLPEVKSIYININKGRNNVVLSKENILIYGNEKLIDKIGELQYKISPLSFFQVNPIQTKKLYDKVKAFAGLSGNEVIFDLYCGIGTISLYLAKNAKKVYGIEIVPQAITDAKANMKLNNINNTEFIVGKAEQKMPQLLEQGVKADIVVVDPPRKGCDEKLINAIIDMAPMKIIYVSCNPSTLARDLKIICNNGYKIEEVQPVDMFPHTGHVESIVLMSRVEK